MTYRGSWWRHDMDALSVYLNLWQRNDPSTAISLKTVIKCGALMFSSLNKLWKNIGSPLIWDPLSLMPRQRIGKMLDCNQFIRYRFAHGEYPTGSVYTQFFSRSFEHLHYTNFQWLLLGTLRGQNEFTQKNIHVEKNYIRTINTYKDVERDIDIKSNF